MGRRRDSFRLWRLARAYRRMALLELKLPDSQEALDMRLTFTRQTIRGVNRGLQARGLTRKARKTTVREFVRSAGLGGNG